MRRPVDPLGYSKDTGIFVCRGDPVHQLGRIAAHQALRWWRSLCDRLTGPSGCASRRPDRHSSRLPRAPQRI